MKLNTTLLLAYLFLQEKFTSVLSQTPDGQDLCRNSLTTSGKTVRFIEPSKIDEKAAEDRNYEHYVIGNPASNEKHRKLRRSKNYASYVNVFLGGTFGFPYRHSCVIEGISAGGVPTIGLTYDYIGIVDGARNNLCGGEEDTVQCLADQHEQVLFGGDLRSNLWDATSPRDSVSGRLGLLLKYLDKKHPHEGWGGFFEDAEGDSYPAPIWKKINLIGFSQGAGHAAYLAQSTKLAGAGLLSGPQDECVGCADGTKFWVDDDFKTSSIVAMAHGDDRNNYEPSLPVQKDNWARMAATKTVCWSLPLAVTDIGYGIEEDYDVCDAPLVSFVAPSETNPCGRAGHCSTALDWSTPVIKRTDEKALFLYSYSAWPAIASAPDC